MGPLEPYVNLMHEVTMLAKTPRSGFAFLGSGKQSVAEHSFGVAWIGYILGELCPNTKPLNRERLILLCLVHDLLEARTGDLNYVNKKYVSVDEEAAAQAVRQDYPCGHFLYDALKEYREGKTLESQLAHDADQLELLLILKQQLELGNKRAQIWFEKVCQRLTSDISKQLAAAIAESCSDSWWLKDKEDLHWVNGGKKKG